MGMRALLGCVALLCGCPKPKAKPHDAQVLRDATPDVVIDAAIAMTPQPEEVAVPGPAPFYIDKRETTIAEYRACIDAKLCTQTSRNAETFTKDPAVAMGGATLWEARMYCASKGKRLPTIAEWKRAAYGDDKRRFPWGDEAIT
jgi:formylglycine-generating enzyme required for sulfatase activity